MTTLAEIMLMVAKELTETSDGTATAGSTTSLTDTVNLLQQNGYWDKGLVWFRSTTHDGKIGLVTGFSASKLTFTNISGSAFTGSVGTCKYTVARGVYSFLKLRSAINDALAEIRVTEEDDSLAGDGETLEFTLPAGVADVERVELEEDGSSPAYLRPSHHWKVRGGKIKFDYGYPPDDGDTIHLFYKTFHDSLWLCTDTIHEDVNLEWLKWKACEKALYWAILNYPDAKEYRIEELMNKTMQRLQGLIPTPISFRLRTAGA